VPPRTTVTMVDRAPSNLQVRCSLHKRGGTRLITRRSLSGRRPLSRRCLWFAAKAGATVILRRRIADLGAAELNRGAVNSDPQRHYINARTEPIAKGDDPMRSLIIWFGIGLVAVTTGGGALAQNTLLLGRGTPPRITTMPLTPNSGYVAPGQPMTQAYRMPNGRYVVITPRPLPQPAPVPGYPVPGTPGR
jgi:hypothetical protein